MDSKGRPTRNIDGFYSPRANTPLQAYRPQRPIAKPRIDEPRRLPQEKRSLPKNSVSRQENTQFNNHQRAAVVPVGVSRPRNARAGTRQRSRGIKNWSKKRKVISSTLLFFILVLGVGGWFGLRILGSINKVFHGNIFSDAQALYSQVELKGESTGRVNILVAGDSTDDPGHQGASLADTIMVLSIDTKNKTAFMFSIPRDLWVYIPAFNGYQKINATNTVTNFSAPGYPKGGIGQLEQVLNNDLGIPIDYYAVVNYAALKDAVNAVGGITVDIKSPDPRGLYDAYTHLKLPNGEDYLNGQQALDLARARGDNGSDVSYGFPATDFDRTMHQRQIVKAVVKKASSLGFVTDPLKVSALFSTIGNNVQTDLNLRDAIALAKLGHGFNLNKIGSYTYSSTLTGSTKPLLTTYTSSSGEDALVPSAGKGDYSSLKNYYLQLTSSNPLVKEGASVEILNATDVAGLAKKEQGLLEAKGVKNVSIGNAVSNHPGTMIIDNSGGKDPKTKAVLEKMFPGQTVTSDTGSAEAQEAQGYSTNFVVVLGGNWSNSAVTTSKPNN